MIFAAEEPGDPDESTAGPEPDDGKARKKPTLTVIK